MKGAWIIIDAARTPREIGQAGKGALAGGMARATIIERI
jgi:hypothetical protein